jgi:hypothetical protein
MLKEKNQIPLGLSGLVTIPKDRVASLARRGAPARPPEFLLTDDQRLAWLNDRLDRQLDHPLIAPGSGDIARKVISRFPFDLGEEFSRKLLMTLRDGEMHSTLAVAPGDATVAVSFVAWNGTWQDLIAKRYGSYLNSFFGNMSTIESARPLAALLQIDAFIAESVEPEDPFRSLDECISLDVEFTYVPGRAFGVARTADPSLPKVILLNLDLCSDEQKNQLQRLIHRTS